jgi:hypothetical protein
VSLNPVLSTQPEKLLDKTTHIGDSIWTAWPELRDRPCVPLRAGRRPSRLVSVAGFDKRYALNQPSTDRRPWPFGYGLNGLVTRPRLSRGVFLVVLARNGRDPRLVVRCRHSHIVPRVFDSAMRFAGGPLDRETISLEAALVSLVAGQRGFVMGGLVEGGLADRTYRLSMRRSIVIGPPCSDIEANTAESPNR